MTSWVDSSADLVNAALPGSYFLSLEAKVQKQIIKVRAYLQNATVYMLENNWGSSQGVASVNCTDHCQNFLCKNDVGLSIRLRVGCTCRPESGLRAGLRTMIIMTFWLYVVAQCAGAYQLNFVLKIRPGSALRASGPLFFSFITQHNGDEICT